MDNDYGLKMLEEVREDVKILLARTFSNEKNIDLLEANCVLHKKTIESRREWILFSLTIINAAVAYGVWFR